MLKSIQEHVNFKAPPGGSVPGAYVRLLFEYLAGQGRNAGAILGEPVPQPGQEPAYAAQCWRRMLESAARHLHDPVLGLHVGATITAAHLGPLGYVLLASSSMTAAMERYMRFQRLVHDVSPVRHYFDGGAVVLEWNSESRAMGLLANQCGMAAVVQFARNITGTEIVPEDVHFVEPLPDDVGPYADFFRCPVLFGQAATRIRFAVTLLGLPLRRHDPALAAMLERQVQAMLAELPQKDHVEQDIRQLISRHLLQGELALDRIAEELHLSGRTLRRRLEERGWNFRGLLEDTRRRMAEDYLRDPRLALPEVALLLGYSEQSAFNRAFLRWTGMTPRRWRMDAGSGSR